MISREKSDIGEKIDELQNNCIARKKPDKKEHILYDI